MRLIDLDDDKHVFCGSDGEYEKWNIDPTAPTIEERKKGKWLRYGEDGNPNTEDTVFWQCSECMETYTGRTTRIPNFCPNCGSEMRGGQE